jgi:hypothetical protein
MDGLTINIDPKSFAELDRKLSSLQGEIFAGAVSRALNRAGDSATTQLGRELSAQTGMGVRAVRENVSTKPSRPDELSYVITVEGGPQPLSEFSPRQTRRGVSAAPWRQRRTFPGTFVRPGGVIKRVGKARLPIKALWGPSLAREVTRGDAKEVAMAAAMEVFGRRLAHEVGRLLRGR